MKKQTPAEVVIGAFGIRPLAAALRCSPTTVYRWSLRPDGLIQAKWHQPILELAKAEHRRDITPEVLVHGK